MHPCWPPHCHTCEPQSLYALLWAALDVNRMRSYLQVCLLWLQLVIVGGHCSKMSNLAALLVLGRNLLQQSHRLRGNLL